MKSKDLQKKIIITGTHLTPAVELISQLKKDSKTKWQIYYIGRQYNSSVDTTPSIESEIIPKLGVNFSSIVCGKLDRRWLPNTIQGIPQTIKGVIQAYNQVSKIKPDIVASFGGYVSVPVIISSWLKRIPSITHEQTPTISLTTKINSLFVNKVALSFENKDQTEKSVITGNLLRSEIYNQSSKYFEKIIKKNQSPIIYITAGNQGSKTINDTIKLILSNLKDFTIIHQTGKTDYSKFKKLTQKYKNYYPIEYVNSNDIGWIFSNSKILISRSGANTSQEIVALKKSSILIPLFKSQQDEQKINASWVKKQLPDKTIIIQQEELNKKSLLEGILKLNKLKVSSSKITYQPNLKLLNLINKLI
ncbi:MAG: glycosyltransferase [Candidatus Shapirobacteria bacterium]